MTRVLASRWPQWLHGPRNGRSRFFLHKCESRNGPSQDERRAMIGLGSARSTSENKFIVSFIAVRQDDVEAVYRWTRLLLRKRSGPSLEALPELRCRTTAGTVLVQCPPIRPRPSSPRPAPPLAEALPPKVLPPPIPPPPTLVMAKSSSPSLIMAKSSSPFSSRAQLLPHPPSIPVSSLLRQPPGHLAPSGLRESPSLAGI